MGPANVITDLLNGIIWMFLESALTESEPGAKEYDHDIPRLAM